MRLGSAFGRLWAVSALSGLGDGVTQIAGALLAASLSRDPVQVAGLMLAQQLPWVLLALPSGVVVDRLRRGRLMVTASALRAAAIAVLGLAVVAGQTSLPLLYATFFVVGCAGLVFENASVTMVPAVVPPEELERANGRLQAARTLSDGLAARPLGGWLFALAAWLPFLLDAGALVLVAALAATLPATVDTGTAGTAPPAGTRFRTAIAEGVRWLLRHRLLRTLTLTVGASNLGLGATSSIMVLVAYHRLGVGASGYGLLLTSLAAGGIVGGLLASRIVAAVGPGAALRAGLIVEMLAHLGLALTGSAVTAGVTLAMLGLHLVVSSAIGATLRQALAPPGMLGRVHSAHRLVSNAGLFLGAALGGVLARYLSLAAPFWLGVACVAVLTLGVWRALNDRDIRVARRSVA